MEGSIEIKGITYNLKASAGTVMRYRYMFAADLLTDISKLEIEAFKDGKINPDTVAVAERIAYIMCRDANPDIEVTLEEWLEDKVPTFVYEILPAVIRVWRGNSVTVEKPKKK